RGADVARIDDPRWRIAIVALMPLTVALSYLLSRGHAADAGGATPLAATPVFLLVYGVSAFCEQIGWTAVMTDRLLTRHRVVPAGLIVGATWAAWHIVPFIQTRNTATWIAWQCAYTIVYRVLLTEVYVRTNRSVFGTIAMHATYNTAFSLLPYYGSSYDPMSMTLATLGTTAAVFATRFARGSREHGTP
ncbi:MAG: CPBP family intramembrane metalloprotease, partial [Gemmatimonadaceae bacterium]|nr:CPBP family intramembrane metalloprotease [Gemmatimonadaceae bacterium]